MINKLFSQLSSYFLQDHSIALPAITLDDQLKKAKESFQTLYGDHQDAVMLLNKDGFLSCNQANLNLLGCIDLECFCALHPCDLSPEKQPCGANSDQLFNHHIDNALIKGNLKFEWNFCQCGDKKKIFLVEIVLSTIHIGETTILHATIIDISLHKTINERLRRSEVALTSVGDGVWDWNISTGLSIYSLRWKEMLGYTDDDILPSHEEWQTRIHIDDQERVEAAMQDYLVGKTSTYRVEYRLKCKDDCYKWILGRGMIVSRDKQGQPLRMVGTHTDITQIKEAELLFQQAMNTAKQDAQQSKDQLKILSMALEQSQSSVSITDLDANIKYVNQAFVNSTGYSREEIIGQKFNILKSNKTSPALFEAMWEDLLNGKVWQGEIINLNKQGKELNELTWISPIRESDGRISHYLSVKEDITERKKTEALLLAAKEKAEKLAKTKSQFLSNMSHEIRTPMNAIIGFSELALFDEMPTETRTYLQDINIASNHLLTILNDILDLSKLEAGRVTIIAAPFYINDMLMSIHNLLLKAAQAKGLILTLNIAKNIPDKLVGDSIRLRQVLINLLGNAIKFTQQGEVSLNISLQQLTTTEARLLIAVTDTGIGITAEQQDRLFQPFNQADNGFTRNFEGTGLGLTISQDLVQLMGSSIKLDSQVGLGSCFSFELLLPLVDSSNIEPHVTPTTTLNPELLHNINILVVEDDEFNQKIVNQVLKRFGANTVLASNGLEALIALEKNHFDIVLMDLHMPGMNGYDTTTHIRKISRHAQLPVIALTASVTDEDRQHCIDIGMNDFISKPLNKTELLSTLEQWLDSSRNCRPNFELLNQACQEQKAPPDLHD